jgi:hypothetical protein
MAILVYRYEFRGPSMENISKFVTGTMATSGPSMLVTQDVTFDDANTDPSDLNEAFEQYGWFFQQDVTP